MKHALESLSKLAEKYNEGFTYFIKQTKIIDSTISGQARIVLENVLKDEVIAVIGGILVEEVDDFIAMPVGFGLFLHQVSNPHKGTVNHSCSPNCKISGFNRLVAKRDIKKDEELTIDYGTVSVGTGHPIIENCSCGSKNCRSVIKNDDYKTANIDDLSLIAKYRRTQIDENRTHNK